MKFRLFSSSILVLLFLITSCATIVKDSPESVTNHYIQLLQGELGCLAKDLKVKKPVKSSGLCGSIDTFQIRCKKKTYVCTMSSTISGDSTVAGITQSSVCKVQARCKEKVK